MARVGRNVSVSGRVQGVFFRAWTSRQADALGVSGWVRNCPDGRVEAHLAGEEEAVTQMVKRLRRGPPSAVVAGIEVDDVDPQPDAGFEIRH